MEIKFWFSHQGAADAVALTSEDAAADGYLDAGELRRAGVTQPWLDAVGARPGRELKPAALSALVVAAPTGSEPRPPRPRSVERSRAALDYFSARATRLLEAGDVDGAYVARLVAARLRPKVEPWMQRDSFTDALALLVRAPEVPAAVRSKVSAMATRLAELTPIERELLLDDLINYDKVAMPTIAQAARNLAEAEELAALLAAPGSAPVPLAVHVHGVLALMCYDEGLNTSLEPRANVEAALEELRGLGLRTPRQLVDGLWAVRKVADRNQAPFVKAAEAVGAAVRRGVALADIENTVDVDVEP